jgi:hypothetical protein
MPSAANEETLFETIDKAAALGLLYVGGCSQQLVSGDISKRFDEQLNDEERRRIRLKLDAAGIRLLIYRVESMPADETGCRRILQFSRKMGIEAVVGEPGKDAPDEIKRRCEEYNIACGPSTIVSIPPAAEPAHEGQIASLLVKTHDSGRRPVMFVVESPREIPATVRQSIDSFNNLSLQLTKWGA